MGRKCIDLSRSCTKYSGGSIYLELWNLVCDNVNWQWDLENSTRSKSCLGHQSGKGQPCFICIYYINVTSSHSAAHACCVLQECDMICIVQLWILYKTTVYFSSKQKLNLLCSGDIIWVDRFFFFVKDNSKWNTVLCLKWKVELCENIRRYSENP